MKMSEVFALYERCTELGDGLLFDPDCGGCPLNARLGDPAQIDEVGLAYTIQPCSFLQAVDLALTDVPVPAVMTEYQEEVAG